jgi:DHA1 family bicyclomycin/chloramphenicol resistance-like MFS transporter
LPKEHRIAMSAKGFAEGFKEVISNVPTVCYTICMGLFFGSFIGYLNSSQQIFQDLFKTGELFTLYFGLLAIVFGAASLVNSRLVQKWGMQRLSNLAVWGMILSSAIFLALHLVVDIQLFTFVLYASVLFFCFGLVFGNVNAMAMEPMGHVAGIAAAIIGSVSSIMSMSIGTVIGQMYNGTLIPVTTGFLIFGSISMAILTFAQKFKVKHQEKAAEQTEQSKAEASEPA